MKKYLATGFITLLPIALTLAIIVWLVDLFTAPFVGVMERTLLAFGLAHGAATATVLSRLLILILLFLLTLLFGFLGNKFFSKTLSNLTHKLVSRIPLVKTIYRVSKEVTKAVFAGEKKAFKETVLVPFPKADTHAIGFVTGEIPALLKDKIRDVDLAVFVPTAPHPLSGYIILTARTQAIPIDLTTEEAFKFLLSCGVIYPEKKD